VTSPWRNLVLLLHPLQQRIYQDQCPELGCPGRPTKDPQFTPVRRRFLCTPRKCQYSPCAEGTHMHTRASVHAGAHTHTHTHAHACAHVCQVQTCVFRRAHQLVPDTQPSSRAAADLRSPFTSWWTPWAPQPWQPCSQEPPGPWPQISGTQRALSSGSLWLRWDLGASQACPQEPRCPDLPAFLSPTPHSALPPFPNTCPGGAVLPSRPVHLGSQTPLSLLSHQNTSPSKSWCVRPR